MQNAAQLYIHGNFPPNYLYGISCGIIISRTFANYTTKPII